MKVKERYQSYDDAKQQLHNTFVELDGELHHIEISSGWDYATRKVIKDGKKRRWSKKSELKNIQDMDLTLQQFSLGYVNHHDKAYYLCRKPLRKWKQGFYSEYIEAISPITIPQPRGYPIRLNKGGDTRQLMHSQGFVDLYDNNYPSFQRAWVEVSLLRMTAVAWHRHWAFIRKEAKEGRKIVMQYAVAYKGKEVGQVLNGNVILNHKFRYLTEAFVEAMIHASQR